MWNAWGIAWGDSWGTSWGPLHAVEEPRRPRANATVKLTKIKEGRAWLQHAKARTAAKALRATGYEPTPVIVMLPGVAVLLPCKSSTRGRAARSAASGVAPLRRNPQITCRAGVLAPVAGARASLRSAAAISTGRALGSDGAAAGQLLPAQSATTCERIRARGVRNLSTAEIAAVAVLVDRRR